MFEKLLAQFLKDKFLGYQMYIKIEIFDVKVVDHRVHIDNAVNK